MGARERRVRTGTGERVPLGPDAVPTRLPELLLIEILRQHLADAPALDQGWLAALHDPALQPALAALHSDPAHRWTVTELATAAAMSRSAFDGRFRQVLGRSPISYLAVGAVARRVGYDAEPAFSRAFKRHAGSSPAQWRAQPKLRS